MNHVQSPRSDDAGIEPELAAKAVAPRVTPGDITANIVSEHFFTASDGAYGAAARGPKGGETGETFSWQDPPQLATLTFCVLVLRNGFTVTGESAPASPANFDANIGRRIARENAVQKCWPLLGYELKQRLYEQSQFAVGTSATS